MKSLAQFLTQFPRISVDKEQQVLHFENYYCLSPGGRSYFGHLDFLFVRGKCKVYVTLPNKKRFHIKRVHTFSLQAISYEQRTKTGFIIYDTQNLKKTVVCWAE